MDPDLSVRRRIGQPEIRAMDFVSCRTASHTATVPTPPHEKMRTGSLNFVIFMIVGRIRQSRFMPEIPRRTLQTFCGVEMEIHPLRARA